MILDYNTAWDRIEDSTLKGETVKFVASKIRPGEFYLHSEPVHGDNPCHALVILKTNHHLYAIWVTSPPDRRTDTRILQRALIELLQLPYGQINVFNNLRVDRRTRYHICNGYRSLYFTDLVKGRFSQKQLVIPNKHEAFLAMFQQQAKDFIIQQTY